MWKPDCLDKLKSEEKIIPYKIYNGKSLKIGCIKGHTHSQTVEPTTRFNLKSVDIKGKLLVERPIDYLFIFVIVITVLLAFVVLCLLIYNLIVKFLLQ